MTEEQRKTREDSIESSKGPGKFEAEPIYTAYLWDMGLEGSGEDVYFREGMPTYTGIIISQEDREIFPELADVYGVFLWENDNGFVYLTEYVTPEEYAEELQNLQEQAENEENAE
jgi:hypothetical protein